MPDNALRRALALQREGRVDRPAIALESLLVSELRNAPALAHLAHRRLRHGRLDRA